MDRVRMFDVWDSRERAPNSGSEISHICLRGPVKSLELKEGCNQRQGGVSAHKVFCVWRNKKLFVIVFPCFAGSFALLLLLRACFVRCSLPIFGSVAFLSFPVLFIIGFSALLWQCSLACHCVSGFMLSFAVILISVCLFVCMLHLLVLVVHYFPNSCCVLICFYNVLLGALLLLILMF